MSPGTVADEAREDPVVLVVDDEADIRETFEIYLSQDYTVRTASGGTEALVELGPDVDVMLLDRRMPDMSGDEVLAELDDDLVDCRIIMVTAVDPDFDVVDMPIDDYLNKPVTKEEITETIDQALLLEEYERLLSEYFGVTKKEATLRANKSPDELEESEEFARLVDQRERLRNQMETVFEEFPDEDIKKTLTDVHTE